MKRSKLFLGITGALLAIVGIAAARQHRQPIGQVWVTISGVCTIVSGSFAYTLNGPGPGLYATVNDVSKRAYLTKVADVCVQPLYLGL